MKTLTDKLARISALCREVIALADKATPGKWITGSIPWKVWANGGRHTVCDCRECGDAVQVAEGLAVSDSMASNRDFIASARTLTPALAQATLAVIELWSPDLDSANIDRKVDAKFTLKAIADAFTEEELG